MDDILASIEIGTNSIRMLIAEREAGGGPLRPILRKRSLTRLGEGFGTQGTGVLTQEAVARSIEALRDFWDLALQQGVSSPRIVATGVVRRASNRDAFVDLLGQTLGATVVIISGQREADLTWKGAASCLDRGGDAEIIFDLGGGSTEFILNDTVERKTLSLDMGAVTLTGEYLTSDPPTEAAIHSLASYIEHELKRYLEPWTTISRTRPSIVGTGGTVVTLAAMSHGIAAGDLSETINGLVIHAEALRSLIDTMKGMTATERLKLKGLESGREESIMAGSLFVAKVMEFFHSDEIAASYSDILEGILIEYLEGEVNG
jgi:exopolyphosphatase/guanosine-5'-triphosphate,3'-diphosphate pyrophosphatase